MAHPSTLYRFKISVSDVDRSFYGDLDFRVAMHPSESEAYLLTRVLAYALSFEDGLELLPGLCNGDEPAIQLRDGNGQILKWIDIGNPSARRLHKASKAARQVQVFTYKNPESLLREATGESIHRAEEIEIFSLDDAFLSSLAQSLKRDNSWTLIHQEGGLILTTGSGSEREETFTSSLVPHRLLS